MTSTQRLPATPFSREGSPGGLGRWIPGLAILPRYTLSCLAKDTLAGFVLTAVLVPAGMGYAQAAGLPAICGLYATIVPLIAYAMSGPSRILVLGPDSALAALIAATASRFVSKSTIFRSQSALAWSFRSRPLSWSLAISASSSLSRGLIWQTLAMGPCDHLLRIAEKASTISDLIGRPRMKCLATRFGSSIAPDPCS